jgi:hypothetical protein
MIKFGSRVDVVIPAEAELRVKVATREGRASSVLAAMPWRRGRQRIFMETRSGSGRGKPGRRGCIAACFCCHRCLPR